jgi:hypothetical protein
VVRESCLRLQCFNPLGQGPRLLPALRECLRELLTLEPAPKGALRESRLGGNRRDRGGREQRRQSLLTEVPLPWSGRRRSSRSADVATSALLTSAAFMGGVPIHPTGGDHAVGQVRSQLSVFLSVSTVQHRPTQAGRLFDFAQSFLRFLGSLRSLSRTWIDWKSQCRWFDSVPGHLESRALSAMR